MLEFKIARTEADLEKKVEEALKQIETKKYVADLEERNVLKINKFGIAFGTKRVRVEKM